MMLLAGFGLLVVCAACGLAGGAALWLAAADGPAEIADPFPPPPPLPGIDPGADPFTATSPAGPGRDRYRPGPYVQVVGVLPEGRMHVSRMRSPWRDGRTVDTPWIVAGAELRPESAPDASGAGAPALRHGQGENPMAELTVLPGVPAQIPLHAEDGEGTEGPVAGLAIAFHDYPGHFFLPATVDTELGHVQVAGVEAATVHFGIDAPLRPDGSSIAGHQPFEVTMYVAAVDLAGRVSPYVTRRLSVLPVGTGDVEVTLTMTQATDLDLYVVDPSGVAVYYGNDGSFSGGELDLDANAACSGNMGVNNEHIFWEQGRAPAGTYTVRVANFESCIGGAPVDYRVTVQSCGETAVFSGRFEGMGDTRDCTSSPGGERGWCQDVVEFEVSPCEGRPATQGPSIL